MTPQPERSGSEDYLEQQVRSHHPYAYRSRQWAEIITTVEHEGAECWLVRWPDGVTDFWRIDDPAGDYEFHAAERFLPPPERSGR